MKSLVQGARGHCCCRGSKEMKEDLGKEEDDDVRGQFFNFEKPA